MKIIAFGDIHMATSALAEIPDISSSDLLIVTGDITNFGHRGDVKIVLDQILRYNTNLLCMAGNLDNKDVNDYLEDLGMNLHGQAHIIRRKVCVYGVGGSNGTPFGTPWEFTEKELEKLANEAHRQARELLDLAEPMAGHKIPSIFVSHSPPFGTKLDQLASGKHVGSTAIRRFIESHAPDLCLTGHIHEGRGVDSIGTTRIINPGMLMSRGWVSVSIDKTALESQLQ